MVNLYKKYQNQLIVLCHFLILSGFLNAQVTIKGIVRDSDTREGLIGAFVVSGQDGNIGTSTDFEGNFEISVPNETKSLVISYTGYGTKTENINGRSFIEVTLSAGQLLESIVVIGYGTVKREDATGSIQAVSSKDFNRGAITSPQELLAGKVAGVAITTGGGPDDGAQIRVRGQSSLSASNDPLIVIDGIPVDNGGVAGNRNPLNVINPNDIESMTVLKDASATAIYGSRASAGVILITTKKGAVGSPFRVGYTGNFSFGNTANRVDVLKADEYRKLIGEQYPEDHPAHALLGDANTDWQDEIYRTAYGTDHNVNLSGSLGMVPFRASVGYTYKDGILKNDLFQRYSAGINVSPKLINNTLQMNLGLKAMLSNNQFAERGAIGSALSWDPTQSPLDPESKFSGYRTWLQQNGNPNGLAPANPAALLDRNLRNDQSDVVRYITNASFDYRLPFLPALRANLNLGYDFSKGKGSVVIPGNNVVAYSFQPDFGGGINNTYEQERTNSVLEFYLNYKKDIAQHSLDIMGGYSWQRFYNNNSFRNSDAAGTPAQTIERKDVGDELYLLSLFGRVNYGFQNRYLLTLSLRRDGTSRFSPESRWGLFPAAALAVKVLENQNSYLNNIKLRAGWGITGQQAIGGSYVSQAIYQLSLSNAAYQFGNSFINTYRPNGYDANIKWEETTTYNLGVDLSVVKGRLGATLDIYQRNTKDLLNFIQVPAGTNLTNFISTNVGNMVNKGIELALNITAISKKDFTWDIGLNTAYNTNEITKLTKVDDPEYIGVLTGGIAGGVGSNIQIHTVGFQPASFYVFEQLYDEKGNILEGQFRDRNGDGVVDDLDKYRFQKPAPDVIAGITSNLKYKNFDFSFAGRANFGNYVYNNVQTDMGYLQRLYHPTDYLQNVHRSAVDNNVLQQRNLTFSDHFVTNASFFRLDHITVGYSFDKVLGEFTRVYATVQNPFVITKYEGLDPELGNGIDNNVYPRPRTFVFGVSVDF
jgi:TonB-linked SusC/RagA family outer membrane protein